MMSPARRSEIDDTLAPSLALDPPADPAWMLVEEGFDLARERDVEAIFSLANGYAGTRGSVPERTGLSLPATFLAGVFHLPDPHSVPELVIAPDWTHLVISVDGEDLTLESGRILEHRRILDLRRGILWRHWRHQDEAGRITRVRMLRLLSLATRYVFLQMTEITAENYAGRLCLRVRLERAGIEERGGGQQVRVEPATMTLRRGNTTLVGRSDRPEMTLRSENGTPSRDAIPLVTFRGAAPAGGAVAGALALACRLQTPAGPQPPVVFPASLVLQWEVDVAAGQRCRLDQVVAAATSRDARNPEAVAAMRLRRLGDRIEPIVAAHVEAWARHWAASDVEVEGDAEAQRYLRFAIAHLIGAANPEDERTSIGARALTGIGYRGHVFWDTELYMLPFYIYTYPEAARALLMYRYHTLPAARARARSLGYRGALYAWESADTGDDVTPSVVIGPDGRLIRVWSGFLEHHISSAVPYGVWQYWRATADGAFFRRAGAEIIFETARFWASRGRIEADGRFHIRNVIGPDEYHEGIHDNAYTNLMAQWTLERGVEAARLLQERWPGTWEALSERLDLSEEELSEWAGLARLMYTGFDASRGLFEQFQGYFELEDIDLRLYKDRTMPMDVLLGRQRTQQSQVVKQPDVLMALFLLWDRFPREVHEANFRYYEPRTSHGSSLSPAIHATIAARLGDVGLALRYFREAAQIDLGGLSRSAAGVHSAAQGGLWQAAVFGFAGMRVDDGPPQFEPHLPPAWTRLRFSIRWRGQGFRVTVTPDAPPQVTVAPADA